jgi:lipopolysaccharide/colanic/teichoic acid biosynthesis glycosyltransferase
MANLRQTRNNRQSRTHQIAQRLVVAERLRRFGDFLIAFMLLVLVAPLMMVVALAIKWESPGPVLDRQTCIGYGGHRFLMLKFRTANYDPEHLAPRWTQKPTRVGLLLRQTRIESLPQLINVVRGEISILKRDGRSPSFLD